MSLRFPAIHTWAFRGTSSSASPTNAANGLPVVALPNFDACCFTGLFYRHAATGGAYDAIFMASNSTAGNYLFFGKRNGGSEPVGMDPGAGGATDFPAQPPLGEWIQFAVVFDRANAIPALRVRARWKRPGDIAWDDGANDRTIEANFGPAFPAGYVPRILTFGGSEFGGDDYGVLSLDNMKVFNEVRSDAALLAEVDSADLLDPTNIFAWWKMLPGALDADSSGFDHPLTIVGGVDGATSPLEAPGDGGAEPAEGVVAADLPVLVGAGEGQQVAGIQVAGALPVLVGAGEAQYIESGVGAGELPRLVGAGEGQATNYGQLTGLLPLMTASVFATIRSPFVDGFVDAQLPILVGAVILQVFTDRVTTIEYGMEIDDTSEFARSTNFSGRVGGARAFARLTAGSKMIGGKSQVHKPGGTKWPSQ